MIMGVEMLKKDYNIHTNIFDWFLKQIRSNYFITQKNGQT